jgi:UDP-N-acetylglucosamine transferase subunit ALG13
MIFVTVGAYDLPFDRLVRAVDALAEEGVFREEVFVQIGHSAAPRAVRFERFLPFDRMNAYAEEARIIISQGGPGSIMLALTRGKIPIVVPRQKQFGEMVDEHQVLFVRKLAEERRILPVYDIAELAGAYLHYDEGTAGLELFGQNAAEKAAAFSAKLERLILDHQARKSKGRTWPALTARRGTPREPSAIARRIAEMLSRREQRGRIDGHHHCGSNTK